MLIFLIQRLSSLTSGTLCSLGSFYHWLLLGPQGHSLGLFSSLTHAADDFIPIWSFRDLLEADVPQVSISSASLFPEL